MLVSLETTSGAILINEAPATLLSFRKGNVAPFRVRFLKDGIPFEPPGPVALSVRLNASGTFGGVGYATGSLEGVEGTGDEAVCLVKLDLSGAPLQNAFSDGAQSVSALLEIRWIMGGYTLTSQLVAAIINNTLH
ncbi:MAG: hypothetical protein ACAI34_03465 [Verrucomicrobium sp.]